MGPSGRSSESSPSSPPSPSDPSTHWALGKRFTAKVQDPEGWHVMPCRQLWRHINCSMAWLHQTKRKKKKKKKRLTHLCLAHYGPFDSLAVSHAPWKTQRNQGLSPRSLPRMPDRFTNKFAGTRPLPKWYTNLQKHQLSYQESACQL